MSDSGTMRVILVIHGGPRAMLNVMEGLVRRNELAIQRGHVPADPTAALRSRRVKYVEEPYWRDAVDVMTTGRASNRSLAAWRAAARRLRGDKLAGLGMHQGHVVAVSDAGAEHFCVNGKCGTGLVGQVGDDMGRGRIVEYLNIRIDDPDATPVRIMGDAIAQHNARRIIERRLPGLYSSGMRYKMEGSPEQWLDAEEGLSRGWDDCEGLAAYRAGELIASGMDAGVWTRLIPKPPGSKGGGRLFHAITSVRLPNGTMSFDDPSIRLGMPIPEWYLTYARGKRRAGRPL